MTQHHDHHGHRHGAALPTVQPPAVQPPAGRPLTRPDWGLIGASVGMRLVLALPMLAVLWLMVAWAMAPVGME